MQKQNLTVLFLAFLAVALASASVGFFLGRDPATQAGGQAPASTPTDPRIAELEAKTAELQSMLESAPLQHSRSTPTSAGEIEAAVAEWMAKHGDKLAAPEAEAEKDPRKAAQEKTRAIADALAALIDPNTSDSERARLWKELGKAGLLDAVLAEFEKRAERDPNDADKQSELGSAYLQKLFTVGPMEQGVWATKADKAFDAALTLDDQHWDARFSKAVSLSFWPALFGKKQEAIDNFEVLVQQQAKLPSDARYAQTHLWLGNMYDERGEKDKAVAAWRAGLELYPDDEALKKKVQ
ncbi:MAG: hypothetical protein IT454_14970 [Planctomycetes bacterium]|nr:hypothetical protein [Planctomycetota bacterium]